MNRREFLLRGLMLGCVGTTFAAFGSVLLDVWLAAGRFTPARWKDVAPLNSVTSGSVVLFPEKEVALVARDHQLGAMSLECPHLGCVVTGGVQGFFCPCHGSEFGPLGEVYSGPATEPLKWHKLVVHNGRIWVMSGERLRQPQWLSLEDHRSSRGSA